MFKPGFINWPQQQRRTSKPTNMYRQINIVLPCVSSSSHCRPTISPQCDVSQDVSMTQVWMQKSFSISDELKNVFLVICRLSEEQRLPQTVARASSSEACERRASAVRLVRGLPPKHETRALTCCPGTSPPDPAAWRTTSRSSESLYPSNIWRSRRDSQQADINEHEQDHKTSIPNAAAGLGC